MIETSPRPLTVSTVFGIALGAALALAGCEKTTTTTQTPTGTISSTTIVPTAAASAAIGEAGDAAANGVLTSKVKLALLNNSQVKGLQVEVISRDGVVTLAGSLDNPADIDRAIVVAKGVDGVKAVESHLTSPVGGSAAASGAIARP